MNDRIPTARAAAIGVVTVAHEIFCDHVTDEDVERVRSAADPGLALARAVARVLTRLGIDQGRVRAAVESSEMRPPSPVTMDEVDACTRDEPSGSVNDLMHRVDRTLSLEARRMPPWFINDFWPGLLRRMALGEPVTARDADVLRSVLSP